MSELTGETNLDYLRRKNRETYGALDLCAQENRRLQARVDLLTAALTEIGDDACEESGNCAQLYDRRNWCGVCIARAVLAPKENAVALEAGPEPPSRVVGE